MDRHLKIAHHIAKLMDANFSIAGIKFGWDGIIGLIPGVGDFITLLYSFYIIWIAANVDVPSHIVARMVLNTFLDFGLGFIPVIGDVSDFFYRSNLKNYELLKKHYIPHNVMEGEKA